MVGKWVDGWCAASAVATSCHEVHGASQEFNSKMFVPGAGAAVGGARYSWQAFPS